MGDSSLCKLLLELPFCMAPTCCCSCSSVVLLLLLLLIPGRACLLCLCCCWLGGAVSPCLERLNRPVRKTRVVVLEGK